MSNAENKKISAAPSWLAISQDRLSFVLLPERAEVVREIFRLAMGGLGSYAIANHLNRQNITPFGRSPTWDNTTVDSMLRSRATLGEYQPKDWSAGHKKGVPSGPPVQGYYPAVIDEKTFNAAQASRKQNRVVGRGRKGKNVANVFERLLTCAYCGREVKFNRNGNSRILACSAVLESKGCIPSAWSYENFEAHVLHYLLHPLLIESLEQEQRSTLSQLVVVVKGLGAEPEKARVELMVLLRTMISDLKLSNAGSNPAPRSPDALIRRDFAERFFEIRLWRGPLTRVVSIP